MADQQPGQKFRVPLSSVDLTNAEFSYVQSALAGGWISGSGPAVSEFEDAISARVERNYTVAVTNGTVAIEVVLRALDIGPGDEVIVPALTFAAPAMSVLAVGARVVLADVTASTWTLDPTDVARRVTGRTRALLAVDVLGHPADYDALGCFGLPVIEDAAEAHGARYKGRPTGSLGDVSVFSFHANKAITTGEGGCVCTDSAELADRMRTIANHGMRSDRPYVHEVLGRNFRMTNLTAAVGVGQVERWDELIEARNRVSRRYDKLITAPTVGRRPVAAWAEYGCWLHTITTEDRSGVLTRLRSAAIDARGIWPALPDQPLFTAQTGRATAADEYPVARRISRTALWLPTYAGLPDSDIRFVAEHVGVQVRQQETV